MQVEVVLVELPDGILEEIIAANTTNGELRVQHVYFARVFDR